MRVRVRDRARVRVYLGLAEARVDRVRAGHVQHQAEAGQQHAYS